MKLAACCSAKQIGKLQHRDAELEGRDGENLISGNFPRPSVPNE